MKTTVNIDVEEDLLNSTEQFGRQHQLSISQLIEFFLKDLVINRPAKM